MRMLRHRGFMAGALGAISLITFLLVGQALAASRLERAIELQPPPNAAKHGTSILYAMDCWRPGWCTAGGTYTNRHEISMPMVAAQAGGHWARATPIRLPASAAASPFAAVTSIGCSAVDSCVAVGLYYDNGNSDASHSFVATESDWRWSRATLMPAPIGGGDPLLFGASCFAAGSCVAAGEYSTRSTTYLPMVVTESHGKWGRARALKLPRNAVVGGIFSLSCPGPSFCAAVGQYIDKADAEEAFRVTESDGKWHRAVEVRLPPDYSADSTNGVGSISCTGVGSCTAVGYYDTATGQRLPMTLTDSGGKWARARAVNLVPANASRGHYAEFGSVSCPAARSCVVLGFYVDKRNYIDPMIAIESDGKWQGANEVMLPPNGEPNGIEGFYIPFFGAVDCASIRYCAVGGFYEDKSGGYDAMTTALRM